MRYRTLTALLVLLCGTGAAYGVDSFNAENRQLSIPALVIGSATYTNVVVTAGTVLSLAGGAPNGRVDTYNPSLNQLTIPAVTVGATTYTNVLITVAGLVSIGGANWVDSYISPSSQLRVTSVQVGSTTYNNVVITVGSILGVTRGMPAVAADQFNPANRQLTIPAVQVNNQVYTNVLITVGTVVSIGAASRFNDAPVQGLCYSTSPSATATASATSLNGQFLYDAGDAVLFWIDGTGGGCAGTAAESASSVFLGAVIPTGTQSSVMAFAGGLEAAATLTALNVGSSALMDVSDLVLSSSDAANLSKFIKKEGTVLPAGAYGSVDTLYNGVQADTVLAAGGGAPNFVTPVAANASTTTSVVANTVAGNLLSAFGSLPNQPTSYPNPAGGQLKFSLATSRFTCPLCTAPATVYTGASASFVYLDGHGHTSQIYNPGSEVITTSNLADKTESGTYTVNGNVISKSLTGTSAVDGYTYSFNYSSRANYSDGTTVLGSSPTAFVMAYTSGPNNGRVFRTGYTISDSIDLTPVTLAMVAGKTIATAAPGCPNNENVLTFVAVGAGPTSVTLTESCGGSLPITLTSSALPGLLQGTDSSGYIIYVGVFGAGLVPGALFALIQESAGSLGQAGHGNPYQWSIDGRITSVN